MNQQLIDQLIKLATIRVNNPLVNSDGKVICDDWQEGVSMSKLIELTVRECMKVCKKTEQYEVGNQDPDEVGRIRAGAVFCREDIREHFGVEE